MQTITKDELLKLKSGSDIRGTAVETETEKVQLTDEVVKSVCTAFVRWYKEKFNCAGFTIAVGHDSRISANRIKMRLFRLSALRALLFMTADSAQLLQCSWR